MISTVITRFKKTHWQIDVWYSTPSQPRRLYQGNSFESIACKTGTDPQHTHTQETIFFTCKRPTYKELLDHQYISEHWIHFFTRVPAHKRYTHTHKMCHWQPWTPEADAAGTGKLYTQQHTRAASQPTISLHTRLLSRSTTTKNDREQAKRLHWLIIYNSCQHPWKGTS